MNFKILFVCAILIASAFAQEEPEIIINAAEDNATAEVQVVKPLILEPSPDVTTFVVFPESESKSFNLGKRIDLVIGFVNNGQSAFNVTAAQASLIHLSYNEAIQNYTRQYYRITVQPTQQVSLVYAFFPDEMLDAREYGVVARIFYTLENGAANYSSVVYNSTIRLVESDEPLDVQTVFTFAALLGAVGLLGFVGLKSFAGNTFKSRSRKPTKVEYGTSQKGTYDEEWLEGTSADKTRSQSPAKTRSQSPLKSRSKTSKKD